MFLLSTLFFFIYTVCKGNNCIFYILYMILNGMNIKIKWKGMIYEEKGNEAVFFTYINNGFYL